MFFKVQDQLNDRPDLQTLIYCPIEIPQEPEPIPESTVIDYWLRFQSLESEEKFIQLSGQNLENYKGRKNIIKKKIDNLIQCLQRDSEEGIQDNQREINRYLVRFDQNSDFLKYFKGELKNVIIQLKLEEYFEEIINFQNEPEENKFESEISQLELSHLNFELDNKKDFDFSVLKSHEQLSDSKIIINNVKDSLTEKPNENQFNPEVFNKQIINSSDVKPNEYQKLFQKDFMNLDPKDLFYKHQMLLQNFEYFDQLKIKNLIKEKYPDCQDAILKCLVEIMRKINDHIERTAPENEKEKVGLFISN